MNQKIWKHFIDILTFRKDLINIIKPFFENLKNSKRNENFSIHDQESLSFLHSLKQYQLNLLQKYEIISCDIHSLLKSYENDSPYSMTPDEQIIAEIIEGDKLRELQNIIMEKGINTIKSISSPFQRIDKVSIPIIIYCIIKNATQCFKYLLINGYDPRETMQEQDPHPSIPFWESSHTYDWDCMAAAIFYGRVEIITILEGFGIEKGENPNHIDAAVLSFRNSIAKEIIIQNKEKDETKVQNLLNNGLRESAKCNNIKGGEYFIKQGADLNAKDIIYQIIL